MNSIKKLCELQRDLFMQVASDNGVMYPYEGLEDEASDGEEVQQIKEEFDWLVKTLNEGSEEDTVIGDCYSIGNTDGEDGFPEDFWDDTFHDEDGVFIGDDYTPEEDDYDD